MMLMKEICPMLNDHSLTRLLHYLMFEFLVKLYPVESKLGEMRMRMNSTVLLLLLYCSVMDLICTFSM